LARENVHLHVYEMTYILLYVYRHRLFFVSIILLFQVPTLITKVCGTVTSLALP